MKKMCAFGVTETLFMGYGISADGNDTERRKIEAICTWPTPRMAGERRSFLGLEGY
jgi:hypothetical protein